MPILNSNVTCAKCGHINNVEMPEDHCVLIYTCPECDSVLRPKSGDCCVFCSYGDVKCPPMQG